MRTFFLTLLLLSSHQLTSAQCHTNDILEVKFNSDASQLISYSAGDGWLCLWEVRSARLLWRTKTEFVQKADEYYTLTSFAFSPDEQQIASGSGNGTVQLWNAKTGKLIWRADAHDGNVNSVAFTPDGRRIISAASTEEGEDEIKVLRVEDGQILERLEGRSCVVIAMTFQQDGNVLKTGSLNGAVSEWNLQTGKQRATASPLSCGMSRTYEWQTSFTADLKLSAMRTGESELTITDTQTKTVRKKLAAEGYRVYSRFSADGTKLIVSGYGGFTFHDLPTGEKRNIDELSRTGSTIDLSRDGSLFAEGGSWGNAAIKITETKTGKSWLLPAHTTDKGLAPYTPSDLEMRLNKEKEERQAILRANKVRRDKEAVIDVARFRRLVYISFENYGEMKDPSEQRIVESNERSKSKIKTADEANAIWLRLHNDSPLPISIPTQSMYLPNPKCFFRFASGSKVQGLCDEREISIWHGLEDNHGKQVPYGFDFGSAAVLLPNTSVLFAVPRDILKDGRAIRFSFTFQKDDERKKVEDYGEPVILRFRESDLTPPRSN